MEGHADCDWVVENTKSAAAQEVYILQEQADLIRITLARWNR